MENTKEISTVDIKNDSVDIQVATAKKYPRNVEQCIKDAEFMALMSPDTAASCFYTIPRNEKNNEGKTESTRLIEGPSVRLAEIFASAWGNVYIASEVKEKTRTSIVARAYCWDLEKNVRVGIEVTKSIVKKNGLTFTDDMQTVTANAACSMALRNAIFRVIPKMFIESLVEKCKERASDQFRTSQNLFEEKRNMVFDRLNKLGIENKKIFSFFDKNSISDFSADDLRELIGVGTALKEGHIKPEDAFSIASMQKSERLLDQINGSNNTYSSVEENEKSSELAEVISNG